MALPGEFEPFLAKKRIDFRAFAQALPEEYARLAETFMQMGPVSFDQRLKFRFNDWRLRFPAAAPENATGPAAE